MEDWNGRRHRKNQTTRVCTYKIKKGSRLRAESKKLRTTTPRDTQWLENREELTQRSEINPTAGPAGALRKTPLPTLPSLSLSLFLSLSPLFHSSLSLSFSYPSLAVATITPFRPLHLRVYSHLVPLIPHQHLPRTIKLPTCFLHSGAICLFKPSTFSLCFSLS